LVNPEIPGLSAAQSRDFEIGKFPGSRDSGIPGSRDCNLYILLRGRERKRRKEEERTGKEKKWKEKTCRHKFSL